MHLKIMSGEHKGTSLELKGLGLTEEERLRKHGQLEGRPMKQLKALLIEVGGSVPEKVTVMIGGWREHTISLKD